MARLVAVMGTLSPRPDTVAALHLLTALKCGSKDSRSIKAQQATQWTFQRLQPRRLITESAPEPFNPYADSKHKTRRPPSNTARAEAARLRGLPADSPAARVVIDMSSYAQAAARLGNTPPLTTPPPDDSRSTGDGVDDTTRGRTLCDAEVRQRSAPLSAAARPSGLSQTQRRRRRVATRARRGPRRTAVVDRCLERLLEIEVNATETRKLAGRLRFACLPEPWSTADFDFGAQPGVGEELIRDLAMLRFLDDASNALFVGPPGVGNTMLSVGLARAGVEAGHRVYVTTAAELAAKCHKAAIEGR
ncbi:ATP-binding protein [Micromonospora sp. CPCC 205371]|nr:ATP-binding protein [Micromonospora sp. CPCC 205371]